MPTIYMVRHGRAAAGFGEHADPGLDDVGRQQAERAAGTLADAIGTPVPIYSSPLARARQTAAPLAARWGADVTIESRVAEIPSPTDDLRERARWLADAMAGRWVDLPAEVLDWRRNIHNGFGTSCVALIVINIVVGAAMGAEVDHVRPAMGRHAVATEDGRLAVIELGRTPTAG